MFCPDSQESVIWIISTLCTKSGNKKQICVNSVFYVFTPESPQTAAAHLQRGTRFTSAVLWETSSSIQAAGGRKTLWKKFNMSGRVRGLTADSDAEEILDSSVAALVKLFAVALLASEAEEINSYMWELNQTVHQLESVIFRTLDPNTACESPDFTSGDEAGGRCYSCCLFPFASLMKGSPFQMIKHRYDPL